MKKKKVLYATFGVSDGWVLFTNKKEAVNDFNQLDYTEEPRIIKLKIVEDLTDALIED
jgi:hypothetical protein